MKWYYHLKPSQILFSDFDRVNRNLFFVSAFSFIFHTTINQSEQCIVTALANVYAGMDFCASLCV